MAWKKKVVDATAASFALGRSCCPANPVGLLGDCGHSEKDREDVVGGGNRKSGGGGGGGKEGG